MLKLLKYVIKLGNVAVHTNANIKREEAILSLHNLHQFVSWIDYCYSDEYTAKEFDEEALLYGDEKRTRPEELKNLYDRLSSKDKKIQEVIKENEDLRKALTDKRKASLENYDFKVDEISEFETRKRYIDVELKLQDGALIVILVKKLLLRECQTILVMVLLIMFFMVIMVSH